MKKICLYIIALVGLLASCSPDSYDLGAIDVKSEDLVEGIAFKIEHDASNPNIVYLTSLMDSKYKPLWNHPQGRSQDQKVTLKIPFQGTYTVQFGVETRGGVVYGEPATFKVNDMYAGFIEDPMWTLLAGGAGKSKTWYLDLDADGTSRYYSGPLYFYGSDDWWGNISDNQSPLDLKLNPESVAKGEPDSWNWSPDYPGNSWLMSAGDYGSMTFNLIDGANVVIDHKMLPDRGIEQGTYLVDVDNKNITFSDATILHDAGRDGAVIDGWRNIRIISLDENTMQLGVLRDPVTSGESIALLVYNYISKDYYDNWVPGDQPEPEPTLPDGWKDDVSQTVTTAIKWVLSPETPFNWANLDGSFMNAWNSLGDYPDWTGFNAAIPVTYENFSLTLDSDDNSAIYVDKQGNEYTGAYTLDDKGIYTFDGFKPHFNICSDKNLTTSDNNQWRITAIEKDAVGKVTGMWVGVRDAVKDEYMVYHLIPQDGTVTPGDPDAPLKRMLCAHTWKLDIAGTKFGGPLTYADPATFPTLTGEWTPDLPNNSWVMLDGDHGYMKFNLDGTVDVAQKTVVDGVFGETNDLSGNWSFDGNTSNLILNIPILHNDNFSNIVVDWGDSRIQSVGADFLRICVVRDADLSGEDEWLLIYNYIPAE